MYHVMNSYYFSYYLYMIPGLLLVLFAQFLVKSRFAKYSRIPTRRNITGREVSEWILRAAGITDVQIVPVSGQLSDNYHPIKKTINLSEGVYNSSSIAAIGIAAHETGHAVQHAVGYAPVKLRAAIIPVCNVGSMLAIPMVLIGAVFAMASLVNLGLILFALTVVFQLVTLPVEFNASRRAMQYLRESGMFDEEECTGARKMLTAAAMTYVAALAQSILMLLYFVTRFGGRRD